MFTRKDDLKPFESKVYLASPTMHSEELKYMTQVYETNWGWRNNMDKIFAEK